MSRPPLSVLVLLLVLLPLVLTPNPRITVGAVKLRSRERQDVMPDGAAEEQDLLSPDDLNIPEFSASGRTSCEYLMYNEFGWHEYADPVKVAFQLLTSLPRSLEDVDNQKRGSQDSVFKSLELSADWKDSIEPMEMKKLSECDQDLETGRTFAMKLIELGFLKCLKLSIVKNNLLGRKALHLKDALGNTVLHLAAMSSSEEIIAYVVDRLSDHCGSKQELIGYFEAQNKEGKRPIDIARSPDAKRKLMKLRSVMTMAFAVGRREHMRKVQGRPAGQPFLPPHLRQPNLSPAASAAGAAPSAPEARPVVVNQPPPGLPPPRPPIPGSKVAPPAPQVPEAIPPPAPDPPELQVPEGGDVPPQSASGGSAVAESAASIPGGAAEEGEFEPMSALDGEEEAR